ncbi:MAG TPA: biotin carboxylase N-terminal domain-containing protein [Solirubrobacterales bacterium]|jgi:acetyl-CoA/propionyl-CoA carboxylase biotin carboxyl carrier protein|nr:biotin carboxylase N-terminal domain-containing protein [Solirubrobacterales bacterium]
MFERVLIANRGEIAVRIERTLARLGVESVAVFSDADAGAPHVAGADRAVHIGPTPARESYLSIERVLDAAAQSGADAIHPGYGFLSERPDFAAACAAAGIAFVGPGPEAMALLGDKARARAVAAEAGVPTLAGWSGEDLSDEEIVDRVGEGDLPLLVKAAAGGGGKGMRLVTRREDLAEALGAARREAASAFGDERLLIERYVEPSRHLEVQVIADAHGNAIHLGERECSLQRRHQKVIEESPSPVVTPALREAMGEAAVALARHAGYVNAGTVELIAERDDPERFFFLEVNTRLQVEHPVTEAVTGLDLVELQLRVAAGEPLPLTQEEVRRDGWAVEARIYAEDPAAGFLPSSGAIVAYREPAGVRVDSGIEEGSVVGTDYDPMLAKVVAEGSDREEAVSKLRRALGELVVAGPTTNAAYLRALLARPEVGAGEMDTGLIERLGDDVAAPSPSPELAALALITMLGEPQDDDIWSTRTAWRIQGPAWIRRTLESTDGPLDVAIRASADTWTWQVGDTTGTFPTHARVDGPKTPDIVEFSAHQQRVVTYRDGDAVWVVDPDVGPVRYAPPVGDDDSAASGDASLEAPMPGTVVQLRVQPGTEVSAGETLVVLESMKMEISIAAPRDGSIAAVHVAAGDQVDRGATLIELAAEEESA